MSSLTCPGIEPRPPALFAKFSTTAPTDLLKLFFFTLLQNDQAEMVQERNNKYSPKLGLAITGRQRSQQRRHAARKSAREIAITRLTRIKRFDFHLYSLLSLLLKKTKTKLERKQLVIVSRPAIVALRRQNINAIATQCLVG